MSNDWLERMWREDPRGLEAALRPVDPRQRKTLGYMQSSGRPVLQNDDGTVSTEESITVADPRLNGGLFSNIPSDWHGRTYNESGAVLQALISGQRFPSFGSVDEAEAAARARTAQLGREVDEGRWWEGEVPRPVRKPGRR